MLHMVIQEPGRWWLCHLEHVVSDAVLIVIVPGRAWGEAPGRLSGQAWQWCRALLPACHGRDSSHGHHQLKQGTICPACRREEETRVGGTTSVLFHTPDPPHLIMLFLVFYKSIILECSSVEQPHVRRHVSATEMCIGQPRLL